MCINIHDLFIWLLKNLKSHRWKFAFVALSLLLMDRMALEAKEHFLLMLGSALSSPIPAGRMQEVLLSLIFSRAWCRAEHRVATKKHQGYFPKNCMPHL